MADSEHKAPSALLGEIEKGKALKHATTNDKSAVHVTKEEIEAEKKAGGKWGTLYELSQMHVMLCYCWGACKTCKPLIKLIHKT